MIGLDRHDAILHHDMGRVLAPVNSGYLITKEQTARKKPESFSFDIERPSPLSLASTLSILFLFCSSLLKSRGKARRSLDDSPVLAIKK